LQESKKRRRSNQTSESESDSTERSKRLKAHESVKGKSKNKSKSKSTSTKSNKSIKSKSKKGKKGEEEEEEEEDWKHKRESNDNLLNLYSSIQKKRKIEKGKSSATPKLTQQQKHLQEALKILTPYTGKVIEMRVEDANIDLPGLLASRQYYEDHMRELATHQMVMGSHLNKMTTTIVFCHVSLFRFHCAYSHFRSLKKRSSHGKRNLKIIYILFVHTAPTLLLLVDIPPVLPN
jgi:hypothetical protein